MARGGQLFSSGVFAFRGVKEILLLNGNERGQPAPTVLVTRSHTLTFHNVIWVTETPRGKQGP